MGKLITIPTTVGWSPNETIQLTVVHRHHKITFCQKQHLFDSFQILFHSTPQKCRLQNGFIQCSTTWTDRHQLQLRSTRTPSSTSLSIRRDMHGRSKKQEWTELNGSWNAMTSFRSLSVMRKRCARMLPWKSALWRLSTTIPMNAPICTARQLTPKTIFSKPNDTNHTNPAISAKILSKTLSLLGSSIHKFMYFNHYLCSMY